MTNNRITLEQMARMSFGELSELSPEELRALLAEAEEQLRKAKLAHDWLKGVINRRRNRKPTFTVIPGGDDPAGGGK